MRPLGEILALSIKFLKEKQVSQPRICAEQVISHVLQKPRMDLYLDFDYPLEESELGRVRECLRRLSSQEPLEYVIGEVEFCGCRFRVDSRVLIPRPETEILMELVAAELDPIDFRGKVAWDLCCGSGCIGLSLKRRFSEISVWLSDLSSDALSLAEENAQLNQLKVSFMKGDLLAPFCGMKADFVFCNPPYVSSVEYEVLAPSVKNYEPKLALVGGETGLEFYGRLALELPFFLNPRARVFLEIGSSQGEDIFKIFSSSCWIRKEVRKDWAGLDRFFFLEIE